VRQVSHCHNCVVDLGRLYGISKYDFRSPDSRLHVPMFQVQELERKCQKRVVRWIRGEGVESEKGRCSLVLVWRRTIAEFSWFNIF